MTTPSVILTTPWQDPLNTFRAESVSDMYSLCYNAAGLSFDYYVGIPHPFAAIPFTFFNVTLNTALQIDITPPDYIYLTAPDGQVVSFSNPVIAVDGGNAGGITAPPPGVSQFIPTIVHQTVSLIIPQNTGFIFSGVFYEPDVKQKSLTNVRTYAQNFNIVITPVHLNGPVYISTVALDPCIPPPPPPKQDPPPENPPPQDTPPPDNGGGGGGGGGQLPPNTKPFTL
jgi:hypothetical protein